MEEEVEKRYVDRSCVQTSGGDGRGPRGGREARHLIMSAAAHLRGCDVCLRQEKMAWAGMNGGLWERVFCGNVECAADGPSGRVWRQLYVHS